MTSTTGIQIRPPPPHRETIELMSSSALPRHAGMIAMPRDRHPYKQSEPRPTTSTSSGRSGASVRQGRLSAVFVVVVHALMTLRCRPPACVSLACTEDGARQRSWRENVREQSLLNFPHRMHWRAPWRAPLRSKPPPLADNGYRVRSSERDNGTCWLQAGRANKFGYIFAPRRSW